jgi:hypothetical protein
MSGCADPNGLENCYMRARPPGFDLLPLEPATRPASSALEHAAARLWPSIAWTRFNDSLLKMASSVRPDVVWIFKGMEVFPATLRKLRMNGFTLVNYNADHPLRFFSRGSGNRNVRTSVPEFHLHLTYSRKIAQELSEHFPNIGVAVVPFGHEVDDDVFARIACSDEIQRLCFLGNPDQHRASYIRQLLDAGLPVDVFGYRWDRFLNPAPTLQINDQVLGDAMLRTLRSYRVQLNFFRPHNADSHNMRTFEVPACGGIMLAEDSVEHREFFENGREAFYFCTPSEMVESARNLLALPKSEADAFRDAARRRSIVSGYTYRDRALQTLAAISAAHELRKDCTTVSRSPGSDHR